MILLHKEVMFFPAKVKFGLNLDFPGPSGRFVHVHFIFSGKMKKLLQLARVDLCSSFKSYFYINMFLGFLVASVLISV